jgi:hypothetical protein
MIIGVVREARPGEVVVVPGYGVRRGRATVGTDVVLGVNAPSTGRPLERLAGPGVEALLDLA